MSFAAEMGQFIARVLSREARLHEACIQHVFTSIRTGSPVTGAPGQPVRSGKLLKSWRMERRGLRTTRIHSTAEYAPIIEDNRRGAVLRSRVGGFHSVKLTRNGWRRIVAYELAKVKSSDSYSGRIRMTTQRTRGRFAPGVPTDIGVSYD